MPYRVDRHNHQLVYLEHPDREHFTPPPEAELIAVFMDAGNETADLHALHYTRAMNATMPGCTCPVICCCGALVGTTPGCETCAAHNVECVAQPDEEVEPATGAQRLVVVAEPQRSKVGDVIQPDQPIPDDVTWVIDTAGDRHQRDDEGLWHQGGIGQDGNPWRDEMVMRWAPLAVTAVREQPAGECPACGGNAPWRQLLVGPAAGS